MRQSGEYRIGAPADAVWRALNDPEVLSQCIEGCQSLTRLGDDAFAAVVKAKIGPLSAVFNAELKLADLDPPHGYTLEANVKGGAAGFGKGTARVSLSEEGPETILRYDVDGSVGGKLAQVGQRLIDAGARKMADDFFARFGEIVAPSPTAPAEATAPQISKSLAPIAFVVALIAGLLALLRLRKPAALTNTEKTR
jgi:carbon monoxide dehydrogenase subunit G